MPIVIKELDVARTVTTFGDRGNSSPVPTDGEVVRRVRAAGVPAGHRCADGTGPVRASLKAMTAIAYVALWNVAGNPAASVPRDIASGGPPLAVQLVGPADGEERLLSLSAQIEHAAPWQRIAPG